VLAHDGFRFGSFERELRDLHVNDIVLSTVHAGFDLKRVRVRILPSYREEVNTLSEIQGLASDPASIFIRQHLSPAHIPLR
jgi:hypothetical protein